MRTMFVEQTEPAVAVADGCRVMTSWLATPAVLVREKFTAEDAPVALAVVV